MSSLQCHASSLDIFLSNNANFFSEIIEENSFPDHIYLLAEIEIFRAEIEYAEQEPLSKIKRSILVFQCLLLTQLIKLSIPSVNFNERLLLQFPCKPLEEPMRFFTCPLTVSIYKINSEQL